MLVANDVNGKRIYANDEGRYSECFCPACNEKLIHKKGNIKQPYFSHKMKSECLFSKEKDYKSPWHLRMQNYFSKDKLEVRFVDEETNEVHIADVYLPKEKIVIEFQHSNITAEEFFKRSIFHIKNGRRIVWLFDETKEKSKENEIGWLIKCKKDSENWLNNILYMNLTCEWKHKSRYFIEQGFRIANFYNYCSLYIYYGENNDLIRRIEKYYLNENIIVLSLHETFLNKIIDWNTLFYNDKYWKELDPIKSLIKNICEERNKTKNNVKIVMPKVKIKPKRFRF